MCGSVATVWRVSRRGHPSRSCVVGSGTPVIATVTGVGYKLALSERL